MAEKKNILTSAGAKKLEDELKELKEVRRSEIAQKIKEARAQGDLSENAEYDAAKEEQGEVEARIEEIELTLKNSEIVEESGDISRVFIGAVVTVYDEEEEEEYDLSLVGSNEVNSLENRISSESPLGSALLGAQVGDRVSFTAPGGTFYYKVLGIRKND